MLFYFIIDTMFHIIIIDLLVFLNFLFVYYVKRKSHWTNAFQWLANQKWPYIANKPTFNIVMTSAITCGLIQIEYP